MTRERRALLILWTVIAALILVAFIADAMFRDRVCVSAMMVDASGTTVYPEECTE